MNITIIGLGQIGASIGLGLADQGKKIIRTGTDIEGSVLQQAKKIGAVDKISPRLYQAVRDADLVILAVPMDQVRELMEAIGPELAEGATLVDTAPLKVAPAQWADEFLPEGRHYLGITPVLNPKYLHETDYGISAAKADLFEDGVWGIATSSRSNQQTVQLVTDLAGLLGAKPLFIDPHENDGLMASTHFLPQFISSAILNITVDQPGWHEARKVAGRAFAEVTGPAAHLDDLEALVSAVELNRDNLVRKMDDAIAILQSIRDDIAQNNRDNLEQRLKHAKEGVSRWWVMREERNWLAEELPKSGHIPTSAENLAGLLGFRTRKKKKKDD